MAKTSELLLARLKSIGLDVVSVERGYRGKYGAAAGHSGRGRRDWPTALMWGAKIL